MTNTLQRDPRMELAFIMNGSGSSGNAPSSTELVSTMPQRKPSSASATSSATFQSMTTASTASTLAAPRTPRVHPSNEAVIVQDDHNDDDGVLTVAFRSYLYSHSA